MRHHRDSFAVLYEECNLEEFLHAISVVLVFLMQCISLAVINLTERDSGYSSLVTIRNSWLEFSKACNTPDPTSNPVMISISISYSYLLNHVSAFQESLAEKALTEESTESDL